MNLITLSAFFICREFYFNSCCMSQFSFKIYKGQLTRFVYISLTGHSPLIASQITKPVNIDSFPNLAM